jgi:GTP-binding protein
MMIDASEGITDQSVKICGYIHEQGKPSVIVMNKWDLVEKDTHTINTYKEKLCEDLKFMDYFKSIFVSAKTGLRIEKILLTAKEVLENSKRRISTGVLNELMMDSVRTNEPPSMNGKRLKIMYTTQAETCPPTFILFVNEQNLMHFSYKRYIENCLRRAFNFEGTPIRMIIREQGKEDE